MGGSIVDCLQGWPPLQTMPATHQPAEDRRPAGGIKEILVGHLTSKRIFEDSLHAVARGH